MFILSTDSQYSLRSLVFKTTSCNLLCCSQYTLRFQSGSDPAGDPVIKRSSIQQWWEIKQKLWRSEGDVRTKCEEKWTKVIEGLVTKDMRDQTRLDTKQMKQEVPKISGRAGGRGFVTWQSCCRDVATCRNLSPLPILGSLTLWDGGEDMLLYCCGSPSPFVHPSFSSIFFNTRQVLSFPLRCSFSRWKCTTSKAVWGGARMDDPQKQLRG